MQFAFQSISFQFEIKRLWTVVMYSNYINPLLQELSYDYLLIMTDKILNEQIQNLHSSTNWKLTIN